MKWWSLSWPILAMESCLFESLWVAPHVFLAKRWCFPAGARSSWCPQDVPVPEYAFPCWGTKLFWWHKADMSFSISPGLGYAGIYTKICELSSICIVVWLIIHWHFNCSRNFSTMVSSVSNFQCWLVWSCRLGVVKPSISQEELKLGLVEKLSSIL